MASLLLIGGTGFFGKSILDSFIKNELQNWGINRVIVMSRNAERFRLEFPQLLESRIELISADIRTIDFLPHADFVIHAAASTDTRNYLNKPQEEKQNIQAGIGNYCRLAEKYHRNSKILYVSSGAVYGVQPSTILNIDESYKPTNFDGMAIGKIDYAIAKRDAENIFESLKTQGHELMIARCFTFVGPWLPLNQHFAIGNFINDGLNGRPILINSNNMVYRSYMHADELVQWLMTMVVNANNSCEIYNVGSDCAISIRDLARVVARVLNVDVDMPKLEDCNVDRYVPSIEKAKNRLGLSCSININQAIDRTLNSILCRGSMYV